MLRKLDAFDMKPTVLFGERQAAKMPQIVNRIPPQCRIESSKLDNSIGIIAWGVASSTYRRMRSLSPVKR
jgi:hypothetical protein